LGGLRSNGTISHMAELVVPVAISPFSAPHASEIPPPLPKFETPQEAMVAPPDFVASEATIENGVPTPAHAQLLAPRPDPSHINAVPPVPEGQAEKLQTVVLTIHVLPSGAVTEARLSKSSGSGEIDQLAIEFVRKNWKFLPATLNGAPVEYWTTVFVPLKA